METETSAPAMTCYRHPKREATIRCTRCDKPICTDCMNPAAVGFQCPDCVAEGRKTVRQARTIAGGRVSGDPVRTTVTLIAIFVIVFVAQMTVRGLTAKYSAAVGLPPGRPRNGIAGGEYYRMLTSAFLHGSIPHLFMNSYVLYVTGPRIEAATGRLRFLAIYVLAAIGGSVASYLTSEPGHSAVGASGAVFGLFGAAYVLARRLNSDTSFIIRLLVINIIIGFVVPNIDWQAHLGGLATGAAIAAAYTYAPRERRTVIQASATIAVVVLLVVATALRTAALTA